MIKTQTVNISSQFSEGLKAYTRKVFNYMMLSLGITALVSYLMIRTNLITAFLTVKGNSVGYSGLGMLVVWAPLFIILFMGFSKNLSAKGTKIALFSVAALEGASVSLLILFAGVHNAFQAFLITGILFGAMSLYGYTTGKDLLQMGNILIMGLWGLVIVSIVSMFTGGVGIWFSYLTVIIFTGLIAYEVQQIKDIYAVTKGNPEQADKLATFCALNLYLDFLNVFIALLRILGNGKE
ncbi:MAG: Bax inhibitor-1 family protein [Alphaproteobacteria bacterium]